MSNKTSDDNVANIEIIKNFIFELKSFGLNKDTLEVANELENLLSDYTRQKQINEEHQRINGELREKVKELEEKNEHLSNTSDYETISLECIHLEEQLEIEKSRIQELEEENASKQKAYDECYCEYKHYKQFESIPKQVVKEGLEDIEDYFDRLNGPDEDIEYIKQIKQELLGGEK